MQKGLIRNRVLGLLVTVYHFMYLSSIFFIFLTCHTSQRKLCGQGVYKSSLRAIILHVLLIPCSSTPNSMAELSIYLMQRPYNNSLIQSRCVGGEKNLKHARQFLPRTRIGHTYYYTIISCLTTFQTLPLQLFQILAQFTFLYILCTNNQEFCQHILK